MPILEKEIIRKIAQSYAKECQRYGIDFDLEMPCMTYFQKEDRQLGPNEDRVPKNLSPIPQNAYVILGEREATCHYFTSGTFKLNSLTENRGRNYGNLQRVLYLVFDSDVKHFVEDYCVEEKRDDIIQYVKEQHGGDWENLVHNMPQETLDSWLDTQLKHLKTVFKGLGIPFSRVLRSGYGHYIYIELDSDSQSRIEDCRKICPNVIDVVNKSSKMRLLDPGVSDPGVRFTRIPGSLNMKSAKHSQEVTIIEEQENFDPHNLSELVRALSRWKKISLDGDPAESGEDDEDDDKKDHYKPARDEIYPKIVDFFVPFWKSGQTFKVARPLVGYLRKRPEGWTGTEVNSLIWDVARKSGYDGQTWNLNDQDMVVEVARTFNKNPMDPTIKGIAGLQELLGSDKLNEFLDIFKDLFFDLPKEIERIRFSKKPNFIKTKRLSEMVWSLLNSRGRFVYSKDGGMYFFDNISEILYDLTAEKWVAFLSIGICQVSEADPVFSYLEKDITNNVLMSVPQSHVCQLSHWDNDSGCLRVAISDSKYISIYHDKPYELHTNGEENVFFEAGRNLNLSFEELVDTRENSNHFHDYLIKPLSFAENSMTKKQSQILWSKAILATFFRAFLFTRPILWLFGSQGSGKTTAARLMLRTIFGDENELALEEVSGLPLEPMSGNYVLISTLEQKPIACFDNYDTRLPWVIEKLCRYATGTTEEYKILYQNRIKRFRVTSQICMTSIVPPTREADLIDRTLFFEFKRPSSRISDEELYSGIKDNRPQILRSMLDTIKKHLPDLRKKLSFETGFTGTFRMVGWAELVMRLSDEDERKVLLETFKSISRQQLDMASEAEPLVSVIVDYMQDKEEEKMAAFRLLAVLRSDLEASMGESYRRVSTFVTALQRSKPMLLSYGILVEKSGAEDGRAMFTLTKVDRNRG